MAVLDAQQLGPHLVKAPGFLPELGRLHHRHRQLDGASTVHLFAHDEFHLLDHAQAHGHVAVDAGAELLDHAGAGHELVVDHLRIGRGFLEGGNKELGGFHGYGCRGAVWVVQTELVGQDQRRRCPSGIGIYPSLRCNGWAITSQAARGDA
ncbi:hypothetical protein D9M68_875060 [compost metagenome]